MESTKSVQQSWNDFQIHTFGYGEDHDDQVLSQISSTRGGNFYYVKNTDSIQDCFYSCMQDLLNVVGLKAEVKIFFEERISITKSYGQGITTDEKKEIADIKLGNITQTLDREYLFDLAIKPIQSSEKKIKICTLFYKYITSTGQCSQSKSFEMEVNSDVGEINSDVLECQLKHEAVTLMNRYDEMHKLGKVNEMEEERKQYIQKVEKAQIKDQDVKRKLKKICQKQKIISQPHRTEQMQMINNAYCVPGKTNLVKTQVMKKQKSGLFKNFNKSINLSDCEDYEEED